MYAIIGASLFFAIAIMTTLVVLGFPLGEFTMGGKYRILPKRFRIMAVGSLFIQIFAMIIVLQAGGFIPLVFPLQTTRYICFFFAGYLTLNTLMNLSSKSKKEKFVMTPLSLIAAICYWIVAFQM